MHAVVYGTQTNLLDGIFNKIETDHYYIRHRDHEYFRYRFYSPRYPREYLRTSAGNISKDPIRLQQTAWQNNLMNGKNLSVALTPEFFSRSFYAGESY